MLSNIKTLYLYFPVHFFISIIIDILIIVGGVGYSLVKYKKEQYNTLQLLSAIVLTINTALILLFTVLGRRFNKYPSRIFILDVIGTYKHALLNLVKAREVFLNIAMFIPVGASIALIHMTGSRIRISLMYCFVLALIIEICQVMMKSGCFELTDIINNSFGGLIGSIVCGSIYQLVMRRRKS